MLKQITIGYALDSLPANATGVTESLCKNHGVKNFVVYNTFSKGYEVNDFVNKVFNVVFVKGGPCNVMITLDSAPYSEMTEARRLSLPVKHQAACAYINRFPPDDYTDYYGMIIRLINALSAKGLLQYISWQLWQEPDSDKYFHGNINQFKIITTVKFDAVVTTNCPIYIGDFASRKLKQEYRDYVETNEVFNRPYVHYSTSLYPEVKGVLTDYNANYPTRNLPGSIIGAYSIGTSAKRSDVDSKRWMVRAVEMLQWAATKSIDYVYFWKLFEYRDKADNIYASWYQGIGGGELWKMQLELIDVVKGGYEVTATGIRGASGKEIILTSDNYTTQ
jgi:hypothetical protein